jgi:hypothetical protein
MESIFTWLTGVFYVILPGFVYLLSIFFGLLIAEGKYDLKFLKGFRDYMIYICILIIIFSYTIGYSILPASEKCIFIFKPKFKTGSIDLIKSHLINDIKISDNIYAIISSSYGNLLFFRHLIFATFCLSIFASIWIFKNSGIKRSLYFIIFCIGFIIIFSMAYLLVREHLIELKKLMPK